MNTIMVTYYLERNKPRYPDIPGVRWFYYNIERDINTIRGIELSGVIIEARPTEEKMAFIRSRIRLMSGTWKETALPEIWGSNDTTHKDFQVPWRAN